jgi:hypothetical protein
MHKDFLMVAIGAALAIMFKGIIAGVLNPILGVVGVTYS